MTEPGSNELQTIYHFQSIGQSERALELLEQLTLNIDNAHQIEHFTLLIDVLVSLDRDSEALALADTLRSKYPNSVACLNSWIWVSKQQRGRVKDCYELASELFREFPEEAWYPFVMAELCFYYRVKPDSVMVDLVRQSLRLRRDESTLWLGQKVFQYLGKRKAEQQCLSTLIKMYPESELGKQSLIESLMSRDKYREAMHVALDAIRVYPSNEFFANAIETTRNKLYVVEYAHIPLNWAGRYLDKRRHGRSSLSPFAPVFEFASMGFGVLVVAIGFMLFITLLPFLATLDTGYKNERMQKRRIQDSEFKALHTTSDETFEASEGFCIWNPEAITKSKFLCVNSNEFVFARNITKPLDDFKYGFDKEDLVGVATLNAAKDNDVRVAETGVGVQTNKYGEYTDLEFSDPKTAHELMQILERIGYKLDSKSITTKSGTVIRSLLFLLPCLWLMGLNLSGWVGIMVGVLMPAIIFTNVISYLIHRFRNPKTLWVYSKK